MGGLQKIEICFFSIPAQTRFDSEADLQPRMCNKSNTTTKNTLENDLTCMRAELNHYTSGIGGHNIPNTTIGGENGPVAWQCSGEQGMGKLSSKRDLVKSAEHFHVISFFRKTVSQIDFDRARVAL